MSSHLSSEPTSQRLPRAAAAATRLPAGTTSFDPVSVATADGKTEHASMKFPPRNQIKIEHRKQTHHIDPTSQHGELRVPTTDRHILFQQETQLPKPIKMISAIEWVPQGAADPNPKRYELSKAEMEMLEAQANMDADLAEGGQDDSSDDGSDADGANGTADGSSKVKLEPIDMSTLPADLRMDEYSDDDDDDEAKAGGRVGNLLIGKETELMGTHLDEDEMPVEDIEEEEEDDDDDDDAHDDDSDDDLADVPDTREFMPIDVEGLQAMGLSAAGLGGALNEEGDDDDASDLEDTNLRPDDAILVVAKTEEDFASLEVHVYEPKTGNLFVHHDIPLPSLPLCLAHGDVNPDGGAGNYVAVGTFNPGIEIWNLDVLSALEPVCILGGEDMSAADELMRINMARAASGKKLKKKNGSMGGGGLRPGSHKEAVMALSWNAVHRQVLASGSADMTVKVRRKVLSSPSLFLGVAFISHTTTSLLTL